jgi:hypothetical protein
VPTHWTYREFAQTDGLFQGDIIAREPLLEVLGNVHEHFCDPKYLAFIVLTQTCDLVLRSKTCKAKHIALAVVRPLSALVPNILSEMCSSPRPGLLPQDRRKTVEEFFHRVLNQNEQAEGWVYLHPDGDVGIGEPAVAMLRISISLRAEEHYDLIRNARRGRLDTEYRNKLGWLKGNLYSRIDTTDWSEKETGGEQEKEIIRELLETPIADRPPLWVPSEWIAAARAKVNLATVPHDQLQQVLKIHAPKPPLDVAISEVSRVIDNMREEFTDDPVGAFCTRVAIDPCITPLLARDCADIAGEAVGGNAEQQRSLEISVLTDSKLASLLSAVLIKEAKAFLTRKGPRKLANFIQVLEAAPVLVGESLVHIRILCENAFGALCLADHGEVEGALASFRLPAPLIEHLRLVAVSCIQESLAKIVSGRLTNNPNFRKALKPE